MTAVVRALGSLTVAGLLTGCGTALATRVSTTATSISTATPISTSSRAASATSVAPSTTARGITPAVAAFPTAGPPSGLHSRAAALALADALLAAMPLPPGAVRQAGDPPKALAPGTSAAVDTKVDVVRWYTVPGTRDESFDWLRAQHPGGFSLAESQTSSGPGPADSNPRFLTLDASTTSRQPLGDTEVTVLKDGGHADLRVSAEVIWTPAKPTIELVPGSVTTGALHYHRERTAAGLPELDQQITLTAAQLGRLRRLLNPMPPVAPGESSCPEAPDEATLFLRYGGHLVVFAAELGGCGFITISVDGKQQPYLRGGYALAGPIRTMVGLPAAPPA